MGFMGLHVVAVGNGDDDRPQEDLDEELVDEAHQEATPQKKEMSPHKQSHG